MASSNDKKGARLFDPDTSTGGDLEKMESRPLLDKVDEKDDKKEDEKKAEEYPPVSLGQLFFRYTEPFDVWLLLVGTIAAGVNGAALPLVMVVFGGMIGKFVDFEAERLTLIANNITNPDPNLPAELDEINQQLLSEALRFFLYYIGLGALALTAGYFQFSSWMWLGERVAKKVRLDYFFALLSQDIAWYDDHQTGDLTTRIVNDSQAIQEALSEKVSQSVQQLTAFLTGFVIAFTKGWLMTLVLLSVFPVLAIAGGFIAKHMTTLATKGQAAYAEAGSVAEEVFSSVRTVVALGGEKKEADRYKKKLTEALNNGITKGKVTGGGLGFTMFALFCSYGLAFWFGGKQVYEGKMDTSEVLTTFFCVIIGAFALGQATPGFSNVATGKAAAARVYSVVDRISPIDPLDKSGKRIKIEGDIEFKDVQFSYPSRPDVPVLQGMSFHVPRGKTFALVGSSGCGKSTVIGLLEKFYSVGEGKGSILVDGEKIEDINTRWLRNHIGLVSQEPSLFAMSIRDNIALGRPEGGAEPTMAEIEAAAKEANAHSFISQLPRGYDTLVGERGAQLSGGQKQRVAIARALLKQPKILLLDEATSALDSQSERVVQEALDKASQGRTTIVIAHRLSTIRNADYIAVVDKGVIAEFGNHQELMANPSGIYATMVQSQQIVGEMTEKEDKKETGVSLQESDGKQPTPLQKSTSQVSASTASDSKEEEKEPEYPVALSRVAAMNKREWPYFLGGLIGACANGAVMPMFALIFSSISSVFVEAIYDPEKFKSDSRFWSLMFVVLGLGCATANVLQITLFTIAGEKLTRRLRKRTFITMLRQPISWFDTQTTGKLTTKLANDASLVQGMLGAQLGSIAQASVSMITGLVLAFVAGWEMTLVVLGCVPFIAAAGALQMRTLRGYSQQARLAYEDSGTVSTQAIENIRTVASLAKERKFFDLYSRAIEVPFVVGVKRAHLAGLGFGFSQFFIFITYGVGFYFGAYMMTKTMTFENMMRVFSAVIFSAMAAGQASSLAPDFSKAKDAAGSIFRILDMKSTIDSSSKEGATLKNVNSNLRFENVNFCYPTRPTVQIMKQFAMEVKSGKTVALVGPSGCGKSTAVSLLLRFYDPDSGEALLDESNLMSLNVKWLREQFGVVSQEPILFATTIKENIAYGRKDKVPQSEIEEAARSANIHDFIASLPEGYDTYVGEKGTQLSGGQKQRIAIARALLRNPKILLLDEATSALDTESERIVQDALDRARVGRTTVIIAHRLSTIQNADLIAVVNEGRVIELGKHLDLLTHNGIYARLVQQQQQKAH